MFAAIAATVSLQTHVQVTGFRSSLIPTGSGVEGTSNTKSPARAGHVMLKRMDRRSQLQCLGDCHSARVGTGFKTMYPP